MDSSNGWHETSSTGGTSFSDGAVDLTKVIADGDYVVLEYVGSGERDEIHESRWLRRAPSESARESLLDSDLTLLGGEARVTLRRALEASRERPLRQRENFLPTFYPSRTISDDLGEPTTSVRARDDASDAL